MNLLYGLLVYNANIANDDYYKKRYFPIYPTPKAVSIRNDMLANIPADRLAMFACFLCNAVLSTVFGNEIRKLDADNTYSEFSRDPSKSAIDPSLLVHDLTLPAKDMKILCQKWLDADIKERLVAAEWIEYMAGLCLQMLREV